MHKIKHFILLCFLSFTLFSCKDEEVVWEGALDYPHQIIGIRGRRSIIVRPFCKPNRKWIVRPAFIGAAPQVDDSLLSKGYTLAFYDVTHEYASLESQKDFDVFYRIVRLLYHLDKKFIMEGFSRGGYFAMTYAEKHPDRISKLYLDAPVCDLYSWPAKVDSTLFNDATEKWNSSGVSVDKIHDYPIQNVYKILDIPVIVVYGKDDDIVPFKENFGVIAAQPFKELSVIGKEGFGHYPHSLVPCDTIVNFLIK